MKQVKPLSQPTGLTWFVTMLIGCLTLIGWATGKFDSHETAVMGIAWLGWIVMSREIG